MTIKTYQNIRCALGKHVYGAAQEAGQGYMVCYCDSCGHEYFYIPGAIGHYPPRPMPQPKVRE